MIRTINDNIFTNIADAIREKNGETTTYKPAEMPEAILAIETGGGGGGGEPTEDRVKTPEELYAECRPADWPVLPDPTEENEIYYLCRTVEIGKVVLPKIKDTATFLVEQGYIDDNGAFVAVRSTTGHAGGMWSDTGSTDTSGNVLWDSRMDTYHVVRTTGGDTTYEYCSSSTDAPNSRMSQVLEIKARIKNPIFMSSYSSMGSQSKSFKNCHFITLYGPQDWTTGNGFYKFYRCNSLICLLFDSEENNIFLQENSPLKGMGEMFSDCWNLRYAYPITNKLSKMTGLSGTFNNCYVLPEVIVESDYITSMGTSAFANCYSLNKASIKIPKAKEANIGTGMKVKKYTNLDLSGCTSTYRQYYLYYNTTEEIENLKLSALNMSSTNTGIGTSKTTYSLRRIVMSPEQTGDKMPTSWGIYIRAASYKDIKDFVDSLPTTTAGNVITIYNNWLAVDMPPEILQIATEKGYTFAAAAGA